MRYVAEIVAVAMLLVATGCGPAHDDPDDPSPADTDSTGVALTVDFVGGTDVAGFDYTIRKCESAQGAEIVAEKSKDLEDLSLPGMIPEFENDPFDERSTHLFADAFFSLSPGCYDIEATPVDSSGQPSQDCEAASDSEVVVVDGETTETLVISQCDGEQTGGLDVVATLNHPPRIEEVEFDKYAAECGQTEVCATAYDPDGDPMEFEWKQVGGPKLATPIRSADAKKSTCPEPCSFEDYDDYVRNNEPVKACVEFQLGEVGDYKFKLSVFDLLWIDGELERFPDSSTKFKFPVYAMSHPDDVKCDPKKYR